MNGGYFYYAGINVGYLMKRRRAGLRGLAMGDGGVKMEHQKIMWDAIWTLFRRPIDGLQGTGTPQRRDPVFTRCRSPSMCTDSPCGICRGTAATSTTPDSPLVAKLSLDRHSRKKWEIRNKGEKFHCYYSDQPIHPNTILNPSTKTW